LNTLGRDPVDAEISETSGLSVEEVKEIRIDAQPLSSFEDIEWNSWQTKDAGYKIIEVIGLLNGFLSVIAR
jgi:DNA-directed RNA polymerase specialized sigma subunit